MNQISFVSQGKNITVIDNGDGKLGAGDSVAIDASAPRSIADAALVEALRAAGVELSALIGSKIAELPSKVLLQQQIAFPVGRNVIVVGDTGHSFGDKNENLFSASIFRSISWFILSVEPLPVRPKCCLVDF